MTDEEIGQTFQVRVALEALAAGLTAERRPDLADVEQVVADMRAAVRCRNLQAFYERDLRFHLLLCDKSGNPVLAQILRRLLVPLFAFVIIRTHEKMDSTQRWLKSVGEHEKILASIHSGNPERAVAEVNRVIGYFATDITDLTHKKSRRQAASARTRHRPTG
jgi:DNA-binding GntR family transcriptional regulator